MKRDHFGLWLNAQDPRRLADKLDVAPATIRAWMVGKAFPSVRHMKRIRKLSRKKITYAMIIDRTPPQYAYAVVGNN